MHFFDDPFTTPGDIAHSTDTSWEDVDLTAHVGANAGNVAGVYLFIECTGQLQVGVRKNGSSDTFVGDIRNNHGMFVAIGVDGDDIFELYQEDNTKTAVYLWGYWTNDEAEFLTDAQDVTPGSANTWTNTALGGYFTGTVQVGCFVAQNDAATLRTWGAQDVDGPDRYGYHIEIGGYEGGMAPATGEAVELRIANTADIKIYCVGAITAGFTKFSQSHNFTEDNEYEDINVSGNAVAGDKAVLYHYHDGTADDLDVDLKCMSRKDGEVWDHYVGFHGRMAPYKIAPLNTSTLTFEQKVESAAKDTYIFGSFGDAPDSTPPGQIITVYQDDLV